MSIYQYSNQGEFILKYNNVIHLKSIKSKWYHIDAIDKISFNPFFKIDIDNKGIIRSEIILESSSIIFKNTDTSIDGIIKSFELLSDFLKKNRKYLRLQNIKIRETRWHNR